MLAYKPKEAEKYFSLNHGWIQGSNHLTNTDSFFMGFAFLCTDFIVKKTLSNGDSQQPQDLRLTSLSTSVESECLIPHRPSKSSSHRLQANYRIHYSDTKWPSIRVGEGQNSWIAIGKGWRRCLSPAEKLYILYLF